MRKLHVLHTLPLDSAYVAPKTINWEFSRGSPEALGTTA
jgi:hypothetical protein